MLLCFSSSFNYSSNIKCCISKHINHNTARSNPSLVNLPLSIDDETSSAFSSTFSQGKHLTSHTNRPIGILEGISAGSASCFAKKLGNLKLEDQVNGHPFIQCADPALTDELLSLGQSSVSVKSAHIDHGVLVDNLRLKRMYLEKSGVCCIVMPCHLSHTWYDEIREDCAVPFLHMGDCLAKELKEANLRPLEVGSPLRIGILSTNEALVARFYQEKLGNEGFEVILPDKATVEHIVIPAVEALGRKDFEGANNLFRIGLQVLLVRAVNRIALACDDLQPLLPVDDPLLAKCIDPMDALARSAVKYAHSERRDI